MSEDAEQEKPKRTWGQFLTSPLRWSLPAKAAWSFFFFLVLLVTTTWIVYFSAETNIAWSHVVWGRRFLWVLLLVVTLPVVLFFALRVWLQAIPARYPEIDFAWRAGLDALKTSGINLSSTPIFLVLGSSDEAAEQDLLKAARLPLRVEHVPEGPAPLHWYANPDGVFLFCSETSWLSAAAKLSERKLTGRTSAVSPSLKAAASSNGGHKNGAPPAGNGSAPPQPKRSNGGPPVPPAGPPPGSPQQVDPVRGTIMLDQFVEQDASNRLGPGPSGGASPNQTIQAPPAQPMVATPQHGGLSAADPAPDAFGVRPQREEETQELADDAPALVPPNEAADRSRQLAYVCQLLRRLRQPICAINGALTLLPFDIVQATPAEAEELQRAVRSDLLTIQRELALRFPVTALVSGLDRERGFRELVRRVGSERAYEQRFGRKYDLRCEAGAPDLRGLSAHLCGAFEDWVYTLFREQRALTRPGNLRLYGLLCKVRCNLQLRLAEILAGGFGFDIRQTPRDQPLLFSGCYFAATGPTPDRQAFVKSVFGKLMDEQENVEWTRNALVGDRRISGLVWAGWISVGVLLASLLVLLFVSAGY